MDGGRQHNQAIQKCNRDSHLVNHVSWRKGKLGNRPVTKASDRVDVENARDPKEFAMYKDEIGCTWLELPCLLLVMSLRRLRN